MAALDAEGDRETVPSCSFIAEHQGQEVLMRELLLPREDQPLGQRVEHAPEFQAPQDGLQIRTDGISGHSASPSERRVAGDSGNAYWVAGRRNRASGRTRAGAATIGGCAGASMRFSRWTSSISTASAVAQTSSTRAAPYRRTSPSKA